MLYHGMKRIVSVVGLLSLLLLYHHDSSGGDYGFVSVCQASSSQNNFGTRMTGAGSHGKRNRSIFTTIKHKQSQTKNQTIAPENENEKEKSLLYGTLYNQQKQPSNQFLFKLLVPKTVTENNLTKQKYEEVFLQLSVVSKNDNNTNELLSVDILKNDPTKNDEKNRKSIQKKKQKNKNKNNIKNSNNDDNWISLEGIYGVYQLPSGWHLVLITSSELVYTCSLFQIRKVTSMEIVPLSRKKLPHYQQMCEDRQLSLLRQSFKEHDFYFQISPKNNTNRIQDITQPLERKYHNNNNDANSNTKNILPIHPSSSTKWWTSLVHPGTTTTEEEMTKKNETASSNQNNQIAKNQLIPDSRFFWNRIILTYVRIS